MIHTLRLQGYRSVRDLTLELGRVNVMTGANGCGKSNLYRGLKLLSAAARGTLAKSLAAEGGMKSVLYAGPEGRRTRRKERPQQVIVTVQFYEFNYEFACGIPPRDTTSAFNKDPEVKEEWLWHGEKRRPSTTRLERKASSAWVHDRDSNRVVYPVALDPGEAVLSQITEPHLYPEVSILRHRILGWRFYHAFPTHADAHLRHPQIGVRTPVLSDDGRDLAAALQTILEVGDDRALHRAVFSAFDGAGLAVAASGEGRFSFSLAVPGVSRPIEATEMSDGTLRYLCLVAALLTPRPPNLLAFNEPETSLHPQLLEPLADLFASASERSQLWIVTHSRILADAIDARCAGAKVDLELRDAQTEIVARD